MSRQAGVARRMRGPGWAHRARWVRGGATALVLSGVVALSACDADPVLFPEAAQVEYLTGAPGGAPAPALRGVAGEVLTPAPAFRLLDAAGNPVPGAPVRIEVLEGGGSVAQPERVSGRDGRVGLTGWRMGEGVGTNRIRIQVTGRPGSEPGVEAASQALVLEIEAVAEPGAPARIEGERVGASEGQVGEPLDAQFQVRITDRFDNPVPDQAVTFTVLAGGGQVSAPGSVTASDGTASPGTWTLGPQAGSQVLQASLVAGGTTLSTSFSAQALPGPPAALQVEGSPPLTAPAEETLGLEGLGARVTDALGNPLSGVEVIFTPTPGSGSVSDPVQETAQDGRAPFPAWTLGSGAGPQTLALAVEGSSEPTLQASIAVQVFVEEEEEPEPDPDPESGVRVAALHLNQGSQTFTGEIPLVIGRAGLLRVFLEADEPTPPGVRVRVRVRQGPALVVDQVVSRAGGGGVGTSPGDPDDQNASWNLHLPGSAVQAGMSIRVELDPDGVVGPPGSLAGWPEDGSWHLPALVAVPTFRVTFLPVHIQETGLTGRITPGNVMDYAGTTVDAFPVGAQDFQVRTTPFVYDGAWAADPGQAWGNILQDIRDLRIVEGGLDRYYHAILRRPPGSGIAGLAYVVTNPAALASLAAVSFDELPTAGPVVAHEFGHNFGRWHTPCGVSSQIEPGYPHAGATLGSPGYSALDGTLRGLGPFRDIMSYCFPLWPSDFTYAAILGMRLNRPVGAPLPFREAVEVRAERVALATPPWGATEAPLPAPREGLLVGGGWSAGAGAWLRPGIPVQAPPTPTDAAGQVQVTLRDAQGRVLASGRYAAEDPDHLDEDVRHFGAVLPMYRVLRDQVAVVQLSTPRGVVEHRVASGEAEPRIEATVEAGPGAGGQDGFLRLRWDAEAWPVVVARDAASGEVLGFLRSGNARVPMPAQAAGAPGRPSPGVILSPDELRGLGVELELSTGARGVRPY